LELCHDLGFELGIAWGEWELGEIYRVEGDYDAAGKHFHQAGQLFEQIPLDRGIAYYHRGQGEIAQALGEYDEAQIHFQHYLEWSKSEPNYWNVAYALCGLGQAAASLGRHQEAQQHFLEALKIAYETGASDVCMVALVGLASLLARMGDKEKAIELATFVAQNIVSWHETRQQAQELIATMRGELPLEKFEKAMQSSHSGDLVTLVARLLAEPDYRDH
jgi:tetratricopeptide (TPR) repeat protein